MKYKYLSFLFFFVLGSYCYCSVNIFQEKDSLSYYSNIANHPKEPSSLTKAYIFFKKQKEASITSKDTLATIRHLRQLAIIEFELGDYHGSETSAVKAIQLLDNLRTTNFNDLDKVGLYNDLGRINKELLDFEASLKFYDKALKLAIDKTSIIIINNNKALLYIDQKKYQLAEKHLEQTYQSALKTKKLIQIAQVLANLGYVQSKLNKTQALENLLKALKTRIDLNDLRGQYVNYKYLHEYYKDRNDSERALYYANKGYQCAKKLKSPSFVEDALSNLMTLNKDPNVQEYKHLKDSIYKARQLAENKYALIKYNYLKQEKKAIWHELQQEQERAKRITFQFIVVLILLLSASLFFIIKSRHKKEKIQQVYNTETRLSKKMHDEVANDIHNVMAKLENHPNFNESLLDDLESIYHRTRDISKENSAIDTNENYTEVLKDLLLSYKNEEVTVIIKDISKIDWDTLNELKKTTLYRVLQELMVNMKKHSGASLVVVNFIQSKHKITIKYTDNGVGTTVKKGSGLLNVENRIQAIDGVIIFESEIDKGFKATITV
ncbi:hypothetical protein MHTCC0001_10290 [Flavobacteriaceae bacterium MHTCC 0001]